MYGVSNNKTGEARESLSHGSMMLLTKKRIRKGGRDRRKEWRKMEGRKEWKLMEEECQEESELRKSK